VADRRYVGFAHRHHIDVHVWTIDDEATMEHLLDLGVDGIMTDRPSVLKAVLERRGLWAA
jgi:glycerophosphoryl diester phosphodiesterase